MEKRIYYSVHLTEGDYRLLAGQVMSRYWGDKSFEVAEIGLEERELFFSATLNFSRDILRRRGVVSEDGAEEPLNEALVEWWVNAYGCTSGDGKEVVTDFEPERLYRIFEKRL